MAKIQVNISNLDNNIQKLDSLVDRCRSFDMHNVGMIGSQGESMDVLHEVDNNYRMLNNDIFKLICNSVHFFQAVRNSVITADRNAGSDYR